MTGRFDNDPVKRAEGRRQAAAGRVAEFDAALAALKAAKPDPANFEAAVSHQERVAAQEVRVRLAREALTAADADLGKARSAVEERDARARHAKAQKDAEEAEALVRAIEVGSRLLARKLAALRDHKQRNAAVNAELARLLGFIVDGETRVRGRPAYTVPAIYAEQPVWRLGDGSKPAFYQLNDSGELVASDHGARKVTERVEVRPESFEPASAPKSFLDTVKLPALDGRSMIWGTP